MLAAQTELKNAQKVKEYLLKHALLHQDYLVVKEFNLIYFPLNKKARIPAAQVLDVRFHFPEKIKPSTVEELLQGKLTRQEIELLPKSQEVVGAILILEIPEELQKKEKMIAEAYLKSKKISTVVKKEQFHEGEYRLRKVKVLAGRNTKETIHHENGIKIKLHLEKTYFSARTANERLRIAKQVKSGEVVLVMFSGAAPFPLTIARNSQAKIIYAIELNPAAHQYALENVTLNNLEDKIIIQEGDVRRLVPKLKQQFDRIAMPLPKTGEQFLPIALPKCKKGGIIHLYAFLNETEIEKYGKKVKSICALLHHPVRIVRKVKCGQFSPGVFRVCYDLKIL